MFITCDIQGRFHPESGAVSAGLREHDRLGEETVLGATLLSLSSVFDKNLLPITGVWDTSNVKSIVLPMQIKKKKQNNKEVVESKLT